MFRLQAFRNDPACEIGNLSRARRTELQTLTHEYQLDAPHGANKNDLHNLILDHLLDEGKIDSETHENYSNADKNALTAIKLKLELAKIEWEQQKEALQMREREAALRKEEQEREAAIKKEQQQREMALLREREREQLEARERDLEIQRENSKQLADSALEYRR
ncbi:uncharacterized protein [Procambarus clarkii]|uniref:uncharacterized protein n=1 Tax=Procambarus clarkii TaxID=6728 RepID=UPI0037421D1E